MKIIFDERPGEIFDFFQSIWMINNMEQLYKMKEEYGLRDNNKFEEAIIDFIDEDKIDMRKVQRYTHKEMEVENLLVMEDIWNTLTIERYLDFLKNLDEYSHIKRIEHTIRFMNRNKYDEGLEEIEKDVDEEIINATREEIINLLVDKNISDGFKWETYLFLRNPKEYIEEYIKLLKEYLEFYKGFNGNRTKVIKKYNYDFKENINKYGLDYLKKVTDNIVDFSEFREVKITTTALRGLFIVNQGETIYIIIGPYAEKILFNTHSHDVFEGNLNFIRNISESTRFKIIQLLMQRDYYGQEIVDTLDITKTNAFYHLDLLFSLKAVSIVRDGQKNYYSLNKDELRRNLDMFMSKLK